jgi:hypothetical protein
MKNALFSGKKKEKTPRVCKLGICTGQAGLENEKKSQARLLRNLLLEGGDPVNCCITGMGRQCRSCHLSVTVRTQIFMRI